MLNFTFLLLSIISISFEAKAALREGTPIMEDSCYNIAAHYGVLNDYNPKEQSILASYKCSVYSDMVPIKECPGWSTAGTTYTWLKQMWLVDKVGVFKHEVCHAITMWEDLSIDGHGDEWKDCMRSHNEDKEADRYIGHDVDIISVEKSCGK